MPNCKNCGGPLKRGNIQVVRPRGKKRAYRIHRRCPELKGLPLPPPQAFVEELVPKPAFGGKPDHGETHSWKPGGTAGDVLQRPQDSTGGPIAVEGVFNYPDPPRYRFFMTQEQADRVKLALDKPFFQGFGIGFEVIPVPEDQVERVPEDFADLVEVTVKWKDE